MSNSVVSILKTIHNYLPIEKVTEILNSNESKNVRLSFVKQKKNDNYYLEIQYFDKEIYLKIEHKKEFVISIPRYQSYNETFKKLEFIYDGEEYSVSNYNLIDDIFFTNLIDNILNSNNKSEFKDMIFLNVKSLEDDLSKELSKNNYHKDSSTFSIDQHIKEVNTEFIKLASEVIYFDGDMLVSEPYVYDEELNNGWEITTFVKSKPEFIKTKKDFQKYGFKKEIDLILSDLKSGYNFYLSKIHKFAGYIFENQKYLSDKLLNKFKEYYKDIQNKTYDEILNKEYSKFNEIYMMISRIIDRMKSVQSDEEVEVMNKMRWFHK